MKLTLEFAKQNAREWVEQNRKPASIIRMGEGRDAEYCWSPGDCPDPEVVLVLVPLSWDVKR